MAESYDKLTHFQCEVCKGIFDLGDDDEAREEAIANGFDPDDDCGLICDKCYKKLAAHYGYARQGFTLIELLVVITIVGILIGVVAVWRVT